ncbi:MAG: glycine/sarcosine/betaine reductase selenoprotein B family protein [Candidatus Tectimicrobiota bacterium]
MARLDRMHPAMSAALLAMECPTFATHPWVEGPPLAQRRVALISTAGLHRRDDRPFAVTAGNARAIAGDYRIIPGTVQANDLVMSHVSTNFDRTGFQQDVNVVLPLDRLNELAHQGVIGSVAAFHYSFMGATDPKHMQPSARALARLLAQDQVNAVLLVPV